MRKEDCFYLGRIIKKYSFKGEVVIKLDTDQPELYSNLESVFIDLGGNLVPFFIKKSLLNNGIMLRVDFEGVSSEEDADIIVRSGTYLPISMLPKLNDDKFYYHEIIGFRVTDSNFGYVGIITSVNDSSAQLLLEIDKDGINVFIPLIDNFIKKIDKINKCIEVETPEGLIDMYLS